MTELMDVTLRETGGDGTAQPPQAAALGLARLLAHAGVDCVEVGYYRPREWGRGAPARSCPPAYLAGLRAALGTVRLAVMVHLADVPPGELERLSQLGVDMIRLAFRGEQEAALRERVPELQRAGIPFTLNAVRATELPLERLLRLGRLAEELEAAVFYVADSNGNYSPARFAELAGALNAELSIPLGAHLHDNLSLALANALVAVEHGFAWIDGTVAGAGKGGGNLATERIALHLQVAHGRRFELVALARAAAGWTPEQRCPGEAFWSAVNGTLNLNQDQASALASRPEPDRLRAYAADFGLALSLDPERS